MRMPPVDLEALGSASRQATNQQLSGYLLRLFDQTLARLPTCQASIPEAVDLAGQLVQQAGFSSGRAYSVQVLVHFILGIGWWSDPAYRPLWPGNAQSGLALEERLALLIEQAIAQRRQLERQLPSLHDIALQVLREQDQTQVDEERWQALSRMLSLRGLPDESHEDCYRQLEADACQRYALPALAHKELTGNEINAYRYYNRRLPRLSDALGQLPPLARSQVLTHVLLAIGFGRHFHHNPLFCRWLKPLDQLTCSRERYLALRDQLIDHQRALKECPPHD